MRDVDGVGARSPPLVGLDLEGGRNVHAHGGDAGPTLLQKSDTPWSPMDPIVADPDQIFDHQDLISSDIGTFSSFAMRSHSLSVKS